MVGSVFQGSHHLVQNAGESIQELKRRNSITRSRSGLPCLFIVSPFVMLTNLLDFACYAFFSFLRFNERPDMTIVENVCYAGLCLVNCLQQVLVGFFGGLTLG